MEWVERTPPYVITWQFVEPLSCHHSRIIIRISVISHMPNSLLIPVWLIVVRSGFIWASPHPPTNNNISAERPNVIHVVGQEGHNIFIGVHFKMIILIKLNVPVILLCWDPSEWVVWVEWICVATRHDPVSFPISTTTAIEENPLWAINLLRDVLH